MQSRLAQKRQTTVRTITTPKATTSKGAFASTYKTPINTKAVTNISPTPNSKYGQYQSNYDTLSQEEKDLVDGVFQNSYLGNGVNFGQELGRALTDQQDKALAPVYDSNFNTDSQAFANETSAITSAYNSNLKALKAKEGQENYDRSMEDAASGRFASTGRLRRLNTFTDNYNNTYNQAYQNANRELTNSALAYGNKYGSDNTPGITLGQVGRDVNQYETGQLADNVQTTIKPFGQQNNMLIKRQNEAKGLARTIVDKITMNKNVR